MREDVRKLLLMRPEKIQEYNCQVLAVYEGLKRFGYDIKRTTACFDIEQDRTHLLSLAEGKALLASTTKYGILNLEEYGTRNGLNYWYVFPD